MSEADTGILSASDLRYLLIDSLKLYSDSSFFVNGSNPYQFTVNGNQRYIYIKNITSSSRGRPDEARIQISESKTFAEVLQAAGFVFFIGYSNEHQIFTAWDPVSRNERINKKQNVSAFTSYKTLRKANKQGIAVYVGTDEQRVVSFKPEYLGLYLDNYTKIHESSENALLQLIKQADKLEKSEAGVERIDIEKEEYVLTKRRPTRDPVFRENVNEAYESTCAFSGMQLDIVEAAHIIPHAHPEGTDDVTNGICLSPIHHRAFDSGLIYIDENYNIRLNQERVDYLKKIGQDGGLEKFLALQYEQLALPKTKNQLPSRSNIVKANRIRGITRLIRSA